jgi:hypothetical protein
MSEKIDETLQFEQEESIKTIGAPYLGPIHEAPEWETNGYYIETNWRINYNTYEKCMDTLFMWHNETVNVWSHILGCLFFFCLMFWIYFYLAPVFEINQKEPLNWIDHINNPDIDITECSFSTVENIHQPCTSIPQYLILNKVFNSQDFL